ncbi:MAG: metal ABC transporter permease [Candidatus Omnitrophota bacterium]|jgi:ABC-type Mn2+/Zn2+ transport system permease subunit|nr:MAG: metal ABC transporter permease [Candidatus Omnitrophota bacterium]
MATIMEILQEYLSQTLNDLNTYPFLPRMVAASVLVAIPCSMLSVFVVFKRLAFLGPGICWAAMGGIALGLFCFSHSVESNINVYACTIGFCLFVAALVALTSRSGRIPADSAIGIYVSAGMALGILLNSFPNMHVGDFSHYLFGTILIASQPDLMVVVILALLVAGFIFLLKKDFFVFCFDPIFSKIIGISTGFLHYSLIGLLAITIIVCVKIAGVLLTTSLLVIPGACARLMTMNYGRMFVCSLFVAVFSSILGAVLSISIFPYPPDAVIVLIQFAFFIFLLFIQSLTRRNRI